MLQNGQLVEAKHWLDNYDQKFLEVGASLGPRARYRFGVFKDIRWCKYYCNLGLGDQALPFILPHYQRFQSGQGWNDEDTDLAVAVGLHFTDCQQILADSRGVLDTCDELLEQDLLWSAYPQHREQMKAKRAMALAFVPEEDLSTTASEIYAEVAKSTSASSGTRFFCCTRLARLALESKDLDQAARWIEQASETAGDSESNSYVEYLGLRARLSASEPNSDTERYTQDFRTALNQQLEKWRNRKLPEGFNILGPRFRRDILSDSIELCRSLEPSSAAQYAWDLMLQVGLINSFLREQNFEKTPTWQEAVDTLLSKSGVLVVLLPTRTHTHAIAASRNGLRIGLLPGQVALKDLVFRINGDMSTWLLIDKDKDQDVSRRITSDLKDLSDQIMNGFLGEVIAKAQEVVFVSGEILYQVPFELLPYGDSVLGAERALSHLYSIPYGIRLAERETDSSPKVNVFSAPDLKDSPASGYADVSLSPDIRESLTGLRIPVRMKSGSEFVWEAVREDSRSARVIQILAHTYRTPRQSAMESDH